MADRIRLNKELGVEAYEMLESGREKPDFASMQNIDSGQVPPRGAKEESQLFDLLFDALLIGLPVLLLAKTALVVYCWNRDKDNTGPLLDQASPLTKVMIEFNRGAL